MDFSITYMFIHSLGALTASFVHTKNDKYRQALAQAGLDKNIPLRIIIVNIIAIGLLSILLYYIAHLILYILDIPSYMTITRYLLKILPAVALFSAIGTGIGYIKDKFIQILVLGFFIIILLMALFGSTDTMVVKEEPRRFNNNFVMELEKNPSTRSLGA